MELIFRKLIKEPNNGNGLLAVLYYNPNNATIQYSFYAERTGLKLNNQKQHGKKRQRMISNLEYQIEHYRNQFYRGVKMKLI